MAALKNENQKYNRERSDHGAVRSTAKHVRVGVAEALATPPSRHAEVLLARLPPSR
jgi:hypothetical protein